MEIVHATRARLSEARLAMASKALRCCQNVRVERSEKVSVQSVEVKVIVAHRRSAQTTRS